MRTGNCRVVLGALGALVLVTSVATPAMAARPALRKQVQGLETEVQRLQRQIVGLQNRVAAGEAQATAVRDRVAATEAQAAGLQDRVTTSEDRISAAESQVQVLRDRLAAAEARIEELSQLGQPAGASGPQEVRVDCAADESVVAALASAEAWTGPLTIWIAGQCQEAQTLAIRRDDLTLIGESDGSGFTVPSSGGQVMTVLGARRLSLQRLTLDITSGHTGLSARGAEIDIQNLTVVGGHTGLSLEDSIVSASTTITDVQGFGISVRGGSLRAVANITSCGGGIFAADNARLEIGGLIESSEFYGIEIRSSSQARITADVRGSEWGGGVLVMQGSTVDVRGTVADNRNSGIQVSDNSTLYVSGNVERNGQAGITLIDESYALVQATIRDNGGAGLYLQGNSMVNNSGLVDLPEMSGNQWGAYCTSGSTAALTGAAIFGNTSGDLHCPAPGE